MYVQTMRYYEIDYRRAYRDIFWVENDFDFLRVFLIFLTPNRCMQPDFDWLCRIVQTSLD